MTFTGTIISAGDNDEGTPRLEIEVDRETLRNAPDNWLFKRVTIAVEPPLPTHQDKTCSRCGIRLGAIIYTLTNDGPELCGPCINYVGLKARRLNMTSLTLNTGLLVRVIDCTPARNVAGGVSVGIGGESARLTREFVACRSVLFVDASARRTSPAGIARVNKYNRHSDEPTLVENLRLQVCEGPRVQDAALLSISPGPRSYARQIFKGNGTLRAFSNTDNLFRDHMVRISNKSLFSPAQPAQNALGGTSAFLLKPLALTPSASANASNFLGVTESLTIGTLCEIDQSKVNAKPSYSFLLAFLRHVHGHIQEPITLTENQIRLSFWKLKQFALAFTADERKMLQPTFDRPNANRRNSQLKIENPSIVGNASVLAKLALRFLIELIGVRHLRVKPDNHLGGQVKLGTNLLVEQSVERKLPEFFLLPSQLRESARGLVCQLQGLTQSNRLIGCWQQFNLDSQFQHNYNLSIL